MSTKYYQDVRDFLNKDFEIQEDVLSLRIENEKLKNELKYANVEREQLKKAKEIIREYVRLSLQEDKDMIANIELFKRAEDFLQEEQV